MIQKYSHDTKMFMQAKEQKHKRRGVKACKPRYGFFRHQKLARGKLNRSLRNAQDCRERRNVHYQCLEEMVLHREQAIQTLRRELETVRMEYVFHSLHQLVCGSYFSTLSLQLALVLVYASIM